MHFINVESERQKIFNHLKQKRKFMDAYIGTICIFGFNFAPRNWALCQGQLVPIAANTALFSLLGTYYGGNGTTNFALPNLQGRASVHQGQGLGLSPYFIGEITGTDTVTVLSTNLPSHVHTTTFALKCDSGAASSPNPQNNYSGNATGKPYASASTSGVTMAAFGATLGNTGGSQPMSISDPSLVMNYSICQYGIFPSRN